MGGKIIKSLWSYMININEQNTKAKIISINYDAENQKLCLQYDKGNMVNGVFVKTNSQPFSHIFSNTAFNSITTTSVNGNLGSVFINTIKTQLASDLGGTI